jgi:tetratricopeptide (TPR) repeat protein
MVSACLSVAATGQPADPATQTRLQAEILDAGEQARLQAERAETAGGRADAWGQLGRFYHAQRLRSQALAAYERALAEDETPEIRYLRGVALSEMGHLETSIGDFRRAAILMPGSMAVWYRLGFALLQSGRSDEAEEALLTAARIESSALVLTTLAEISSVRGNDERALELLLAAWKKEPQAGQIAFRIALAYRGLGDAGEARIWLDKPVGNRLAPTIDDPVLLQVAHLGRTARFYELAADWAVARGDRERAIAALGRAARVEPHNVAIGMRRIGVLAEFDVPRAVDAVRTALGHNPGSARLWYTLAWLLRTTDDDKLRQEAVAAAERSVAISDEVSGRRLLAALAMAGHRYDVAAQNYVQLVGSDSEDSYHRYWLGMAMLANRDCAGIPQLLAAIQIKPAWGAAHIALARGEAVCGEGETAGRRVAALVRSSDSVDIRLTRAFVLLMAGSKQEAVGVASAELPHADAAMIIEAASTSGSDPLVFHADSAWWLPVEVSKGVP